MSDLPNTGSVHFSMNLSMPTGPQSWVGAFGSPATSTSTAAGSSNSNNSNQPMQHQSAVFTTGILDFAGGSSADDAASYNYNCGSGSGSGGSSSSAVASSSSVNMSQHLAHLRQRFASSEGGFVQQHSDKSSDKNNVSSGSDGNASSIRAAPFMNQRSSVSGGGNNSNNNAILLATGGLGAHVRTQTSDMLQDEDAWVFTQELGKGAFGCVSLGYRRHDPVKRLVAVKTAFRPAVDASPASGGDLSELATLKHEVDFLLQVGGSAVENGVMQLLGFERFNNNRERGGRAGARAVLEYCQGGSLESFIKQKKEAAAAAAVAAGGTASTGGDAVVSEAQTRELVWFLFHSLAQLEPLGIVHRDIKPQNVLLVPADEDDDGSADSNSIHSNKRPHQILIPRLADFGSSASLIGHSTDHVIGTVLFLSPESFDHASGGNAIAGPGHDVWSTGCIAVQCLTGEKPWVRQVPGLHGLGQRPAFFKLKEFLITNPDVQPDLSAISALSTECKDFLSKIFVTDPSRRWTAAHLLQHAWFDPVRRDRQLVLSVHRTLLRRQRQMVLHAAAESRTEPLTSRDFIVLGRLLEPMPTRLKSEAGSMSKSDGAADRDGLSAHCSVFVEDALADLEELARIKNCSERYATFQPHLHEMQQQHRDSATTTTAMPMLLDKKVDESVMHSYYDGIHVSRHAIFVLVGDKIYNRSSAFLTACLLQPGNGFWWHTHARDVVESSQPQQQQQFKQPLRQLRDLMAEHHVTAVSNNREDDIVNGYLARDEQAAALESWARACDAEPTTSVYWVNLGVSLHGLLLQQNINKVPDKNEHDDDDERQQQKQKQQREDKDRFQQQRIDEDSCSSGGWSDDDELKKKQNRDDDKNNNNNNNFQDELVLPTSRRASDNDDDDHHHQDCAGIQRQPERVAYVGRAIQFSQLAEERQPDVKPQVVATAKREQEQNMMRKMIAPMGRATAYSQMATIQDPTMVERAAAMRLQRLYSEQQQVQQGREQQQQEQHHQHQHQQQFLLQERLHQRKMEKTRVEEQFMDVHRLASNYMVPGARQRPLREPQQQQHDMLFGGECTAPVMSTSGNNAGGPGHCGSSDQQQKASSSHVGGWQKRNKKNTEKNDDDERGQNSSNTNNSNNHSDQKNGGPTSSSSSSSSPMHISRVRSDSISMDVERIDWLQPRATGDDLVGVQQQASGAPEHSALVVNSSDICDANDNVSSAARFSRSQQRPYMPPTRLVGNDAGSSSSNEPLRVFVCGALRTVQDCFLEAVRADNRASSAWLNLGICLEKQQQQQEAASSSPSPSSSSTSVLVGEKHYSAKDCFVAATEADYRNADAWLKLSQILLESPCSTTVTVRGAPYTAELCLVRSLEENPSETAWRELLKLLKKKRNGNDDGERTISIRGHEIGLKECEEKLTVATRNQITM